MNWWQLAGFPIVRLYDGLSELNTPSIPHNISEFSRVFRTLEAFSLGLATANKTEHLKHTRKIIKFVRHVVTDHSSNGALLRDGAFREIVEMDPLIANMMPISETDSPFEAHKDLQRMLLQYERRRDDNSLDKVGAALGELICVIRGNTIHVEKSSSYNRDLDKRNSKVLEAAILLIQSLLEHALDKPNSRLAVYGSLRRGEINHHKISDLGDPISAEAEGLTTFVDDFPIFEWATPGKKISFEIYFSPKLTKTRWDELDEFEGRNYRRLILPFICGDDQLPIIATTFGKFR